MTGGARVAVGGGTTTGTPTTADARVPTPGADSPEAAEELTATDGAERPAPAVGGSFITLGLADAEACGPDGCAH